MANSAASMSCVAIVFLLSASAPIFAQISPGSLLPLSSSLEKLFGSTTGFTANADVQVFDASRQEILRTPLAVSYLDGKMRVDLDMGRMKGKTVNPAIIQTCKSTGLDRVASIVRPDKKLVYLSFSGARSYLALDCSKADSVTATKGLKLQKQIVGKESLDGQTCLKEKIRVTNPAGSTLLTGTTWSARELKSFPIQIVIQTGDNAIAVRFHQIRLGKPSRSLFEAPAGYVKFNGQEALMLSASMNLGGVSQKKSTTSHPTESR